jgi:hypothetical protein
VACSDGGGGVRIYDGAEICINGVPYAVGKDFSCEFAFGEDRVDFASVPKPESYECSFETTMPKQAWERLFRGTAPPYCRKCAGKGTRAHHRKCEKRGVGHRGRRLDVAKTELFGPIVGVQVSVRQGRSGRWVSLPAAQRLMRSSLSFPRATRSWLEERARLLGLGAGVKVTSDAPERIVVTPSGRRPWWLLERAQREFDMHAPVGSRLVIAELP